MWTVLIADDEPKIRRGLARMVENHTELSLKVCGQAADGIQALQLAEAHTPDIILLDICMPKMDGLEFLVKLRELGLSCRIIILTGFDNFSYAQACVSLNAFAYLLKPADKSEIFLHIENAIKSLKEERIAERKIDHLEQNETRLRQIFGQRWISGKLTEAQLKEQLDLWQIDFSGRRQLTILRPIFSSKGLTNQNERTLFLFGFANMMSEILEPFGVEFIFHGEPDICMAITHQIPSAKHIIRLQEAVDQYFQVDSSVAHQWVSDPKDIPQAFELLLKEIRQEDGYSEIARVAKMFMDKNYTNPELSLQDLAKHLTMSHTYVSRIIRKELSLSFVDYITQKRMEAAKQLMGESDKKLSDIAELVGYTSQHYFSSVFKKHFGISPSVYRQKLEGDEN